MRAVTLASLALAWAAAAGAEDGGEALRRAAAAGEVESVRSLVPVAPADLDEPDEAGRTALMYAAEGGHDEIVTLLLEAGADVGRSDAAGETALHLAARRGRLGAVRLLLRAGADLDRRDAKGRTALYRAIEEREEEIIEMLQAVALARGSGLRSEAPGDRREEAVPPRIVESTPAPYTETALAGGIEGTVVLMVLVRRDGSVGAASVAKPLEDTLDASALRTVRRWKFAPAMRGGRSVEMVVEVEVTFELPLKD